MAPHLTPQFEPGNRVRRRVGIPPSDLYRDGTVQRWYHGSPNGRGETIILYAIQWDGYTYEECGYLGSDLERLIDPEVMETMRIKPQLTGIAPTATTQPKAFPSPQVVEGSSASGARSPSASAKLDGPD